MVDRQKIPADNTNSTTGTLLVIFGAFTYISYVFRLFIFLGAHQVDCSVLNQSIVSDLHSVMLPET